MKKSFIIVIVIIFLFLISIGGYFYLFKKPSQISLKNQQKDIHSPCLEDNEKASFEFIGNRHTATSADVIITDKNMEKEIFRFRVDNLPPNHYWPYEIHKCGVYAIRQFNYEPETRRATPGYRIELWKYSYSDAGNFILLFSATDEKGLYKSNFSSDFRVDPLEIYVALTRSYRGHPDFALVIRNFSAAIDNFTLLYNELTAKNRFISGVYGLKEWTNKGDYFWADLFEGANVNAFIRIKRETWEIDILPAPKDVLGGDALNAENGYITVHPGNLWIGIYEMNEEEKERRRAQGIGTELYIHNLITGDRQFVDKTAEPLWYFKPWWLSDTELEYELPTGEKKIYKIIDK